MEIFPGGAQPGMEYLSFVRSLDPYQFNLLSMSGQRCDSIGTPEAPVVMTHSSSLREEWCIFSNAAANIIHASDAMNDANESQYVDVMERKHEHLKRFWLGIKERVPIFFWVADTLLGATIG